MKAAAEEGRIVTDSLETILATVLGTFPEAEIAEDSDGQIIIYTGMYETGDPSTPLVSADDIAFDDNGDRMDRDWHLKGNNDDQ